MDVSTRNTGRSRVATVVALCGLGLCGAALCGVAAGATMAHASGSPQPSAWPPGVVVVAPPDRDGTAGQIAKIVTGDAGITVMSSAGGLASLAYCDPGTVSNGSGGQMSARCGINYPDGSVWRQKVTVILNDQGDPVFASASLGTEVLPPLGG